MRENIRRRYDSWDALFKQILARLFSIWGILEENIRFIIKDLGWEKIFQNTDPEDVDPGLVIKWLLACPR